MERGHGVGVPEVAGERLRLRAWREADLAPFAEMNADPQVASWLSGPLTRAESDAFVERIQEHMRQHGFGFWALELPGVADFAGYVGFAVPNFEADFMPCVEIGWRLCPAYWGHGYVTEAARGCLGFAFRRVGLSELLSFTAIGNQRSRAVMERIGMRESREFDHPKLDVTHPLRRHVIYRLAATEWEGATP